MPDLFDESNLVKPSWVSWGKVGDYIRATLLDVREMKSNLPGKEGTMVKVYECRAHEGKFHDIVVDQATGTKVAAADPTVIQKGEIWMIGGKPGIDNAMRRMQKGQIFGMRFAAITPSKTPGFNPSKTINVFQGEIDPDYQGEKGSDVAIPTDQIKF